MASVTTMTQEGASLAETHNDWRRPHVEKNPDCLAIIAIFLIIVALQPSEFHVERTAMAAPQATVFDQVSDFHKWDAWSPWAKLDPNARSRSKARRQAPARS